MPKLLVTAGWDHAPHLDEATKARLIDSYPLHERAARTKGEPLLGSGRVFPLSEEQIVIHPIPIPGHWHQMIGIDFGWDHPSAAVLMAWEKDTDTIYIVREYREKEVTPIILAATVKGWGGWIPVAWPHDGLQHDKGSGQQLAAQYRQAGLKMLPERATFEDGSNGVEAGIMEMIDRMQTGRWKVFSTCQKWREEFRLYHRKDGLIVKLNDDLISASRYAYMMRRFAVLRAMERTAVVARYQPTDPGMGM